MIENKKLKIWFIINGSMKSEKFYELYGFLHKSAKEKNIELVQYSNDSFFMSIEKLQEKINDEKPDGCIFGDKDVILAKQLELCGLRLFNSSTAIKLCDDKTLTYLKLANSGIKMPKTILVPMIFYPIDWTTNAFIDKALTELKFPIVVKQSIGSFGMQVYLVKSRDELCACLNKIGTNSVLLQEFIETSFGKDIRINVVGGKVVAAMERNSCNGDFRANITIGGQASCYSPTEAECKMAIKVCECLGLDWAGVDILFGENNTPVLCEVNSNAHFVNIYNCTKVNVADYIIDYVKEECMKNKLINAYKDLNTTNIDII